jgi:hypothetical protein
VATKSVVWTFETGDLNVKLNLLEKQSW